MSGGTLTFPTPASLGSLDHYIQAVNRFPLLTAEQEVELGRRLQRDDDLGAAREAPRAGEIFRQPQHPYTAALMRSVPVPDPRIRTSDGILGGEVPSPAAPPSGCYFHPRCRHAVARCRVEAPALREIAPGHFTRCHLAGEMVF